MKRIVSESGLYTTEYKEILDMVVNSKWINYNTFEVMYGALASKYEADTGIDFNISKFDEKMFSMSIDDTYNNGKGSNGNMSIKDYFTNMKENYYEHRDIVE